jgi:hypothetical protein
MVTREIMATDATIQEWAPLVRSISNGSVIHLRSAEFPVNLDKIETKLGRWLAENVFTTRREDDASRVSLLFADTGAATAVRGLTADVPAAIRDAAALESELQTIEHRIAQMRRVREVYPGWGFDFRIETFAWPVFGSQRAAAAKTTEQYFDLCAKMIRASGAVILSAGILSAELPSSLARTMCLQGGGGDDLIERHRKVGQVAS